MSAVYPLISTKTRIPPRAENLLRRERLLNFIHSNIQHKLILISAGAGYGKTSLLIDYAYDTDLPICWLSLDANDAYAPTFVEYLVEAFRARFPQFGQRVLDALRHYAGPAEDVEPFVRLLIEEIERTVGTYTVLILDDYQEVLESEPVNALLDGLLRYLPEQCHIILASRGIPRRLTLSRLAARQEVVGLGVNHLRFTEDEIRLVLEALGRDDFTPEQVRLLAERSEGWITGVLLAIQANRWTETTEDILRLSGTNEGVFDYMASEILEKQDPATRDFLLGSSLLAEMSAPLCDALLGITNSAQILNYLVTQGLFTSRLDAEGIWYRYHQMFREFLSAKLQRDDPALFRRLCLRQAELMANQGRWSQAIEGYLTAGAYEQAADAIEIVAQEMFLSGDRKKFARWVDALPDRILEQHPLLILRRGRIHTESNEWDRAEAMLERSFRLFMEREDLLNASRALVQRAIMYRLRNVPDEAVAILQRVCEIGGERDTLCAIQLHHNLGICYYMLNRSTEGDKELNTALELARRAMDDTNAALIAQDIGHTAVMRGRLLEGRQYFHQALLYWRKIGNLSELSTTLQGLGVVHHYLGQYSEAESRFQESLIKARDHSNRRLEAYALLNLGDLYRDTNQYERALEAYNQAIEVASMGGYEEIILYGQAGKAEVYRLMGNLDEAHRLLVETLDQAPEGKHAYEAGLCHLGLGAVWCAWGDSLQAKEHLTTALNLFERVGDKRALGRTHVQLALLAYAQSFEREVAHHLREVARLAEELGTEQFIVAEGPAVVPLLQYGAEGLNGLRIRAEIERLFPSARGAAPLFRPTRRYVLELYGLRGGQVLFEGEPVVSWEAVSARDMTFLLALYPDGLPRDQIVAHLWPEINPAKASSQFYATMHRLRKALSKDAVVYEHGLYRLNPSRPYWYDVAEFEELVRRARAGGEAAHLARVRAIQLYQTDFLEMCDLEWADSIRYQLQMEILQILEAEANYALANDNIAEAETLFLRLLGYDPYAEHAHRGLIQCRLRRNDRDGALRQFRECFRILEEIGSQPSPETMALYQTVRAGRPARTVG